MVKGTSTMSQASCDFTPHHLCITDDKGQPLDLFLAQSHTAWKLVVMNGAPMHFGNMASPLQPPYSQGNTVPASELFS